MKNNELLNYLVCDFNHTVRDPLWHDIHLSDGLLQLLHTKPVQKLDRIRQLGPTALVYPGAVHTRLSHSLGVCHLSSQMLISLIRKGYQGFSICGASSFLSAALLHDLGHFPYAHSLKDIISEDHEALGAGIILQDRSIQDAIELAGGNVQWVCAIIDNDREVPNREIGLYRNMLSGTLDPDKLDYLCRDAFFCGVPYGVQDVSYIIDQLEVSGDSLAVQSRSLPSIEHLLFSKYLMYKNVYWNKRVRCATAMVREALSTAMADHSIAEEDLFGLDDYQFVELCRSRKIRKLDLIEAVENNCLLEELKCIPCQEDPKTVREEYGELTGKGLILDIPERISFESSLLISDLGQRFIDCDPVFNSRTIGGFTRSLRMARVFGPSPEASGE